MKGSFRAEKGDRIGQAAAVLLTALVLLTVSTFFSSLLLGFFRTRTWASAGFGAAAADTLCFLPWWVLLLLLLSFRKPCRIRMSGLRKNSGIRPVLIGLAAGLLLCGICVSVPVLFGGLRFRPGIGFQPDCLLLVFFVFIQAGAEELLFRFFLQQQLEGIPVCTPASIGLQAVCFSLAHIGNSGFSFFSAIGLILSGLIYGILFRRYGFFPTAAMHTGWNFAQSILFGLPNSGVFAGYTVFSVELPSGGISPLLYDPDFGPEGTPVSLCIHFLLLLILFFFFRSHKDTK